MEYRDLGRTGVKVSPLCLGMMTLALSNAPDDAFAIVDRAVGDGINFNDTSNNYGRGRSEEVTGQAIKRTGKRQRIVLATKVHNRMADDPNAQGSSRRHIVEQCEASLPRLQTDYLDLYQIHRPTSGTPIDETLRALDDLVRAGKVRYIGSSTFAAWQLMESLWVSKDLRLNRFVSEQPPYNMLDRRVERELIPFAQTYGFAILPWSPLAGGLLSGKYDRDGSSKDGTRYSGLTDDWTGAQSSEAAWNVVDRLKSHVQTRGDCTLSQFALAWCAHQPGVTSAIVGPRTMAQLEDNLKALDVEVTDADRAVVDVAVPPGQMVSAYYEADFGPHRHRW